MTVEQKAKRYDETFERVKELLSRCRTNRDRRTMVYRVEDIESIFPELKESEDGKIRKAILALVRQSSEVLDKQNQNNMIAWLEKQKTTDVLDKEEREFADNVDSYRKDMDEFYKKGYNAGREAEKQYWLGKQDEQKSADNVEPKFKVGDWVVSDLDGIARQISEVHFDEYNSYYVVDGKSVNLEEYDRLHHLWTITDAKDGDILIYNDSIFIFDEIYENDLIYYGIYEHNKFHNDKYYSFLDLNTININNIHPATKEQRDLLFQKIKEVGYDWDTEKKELKIIDWYKHIKYEPNCPSIIE